MDIPLVPEGLLVANLPVQESPAKRVIFEQNAGEEVPPPLPVAPSSSPTVLPSTFIAFKATPASSPLKHALVEIPVAGGSGINKGRPGGVPFARDASLAKPVRPLKRARFEQEEKYEGKGKGRALEIIELMDDDEDEDAEVELNNNEVQVVPGALPSTPVLPPPILSPIVKPPTEEDLKLASILAIVPDVTPDYLLLLLRDPRTSGLIAHVLDLLFSAEYPKVVAANKNGKGKDKEVLPGVGGTDWLDLKSRKRLGLEYETAAYVIISIVCAP